MDFAIHLRDGYTVETAFRDHVVTTDQPVKAGGGGKAPAPFDLFLASIATCAGFYVQRFCRTRDIPTDGIDLAMRTTRNPETHMIARIEIDIRLPSDFPEKYESAVIRAADTCAVKKHIDGVIEFDTRVVR